LNVCISKENQDLKESLLKIKQIKRCIFKESSLVELENFHNLGFILKKNSD
jgi:hypothetical protein